MLYWGAGMLVTKKNSCKGFWLWYNETIRYERGCRQCNVVGKIDQEIYQCITNDIVTDEVIITDERIEHIKERHPNDYERFCSYIPEMISNPDYIIEAE